jgi:hypothetical protein
MEISVTMDQILQTFLNELKGFTPEQSSLDLLWELLFPDHRKHWHHLVFRKHKETFYITDIHGKGETLEITEGGLHHALSALSKVVGNHCCNLPSTGSSLCEKTG